MVSVLRSNWFILALIAGVVAALAAPAAFVPLVRWLPPRLVVVAALFLMSWTMPSRDLRDEAARPWAALWSLVISFGLLPLLAWVLGPLTAVHDLRVGLLIAASVPCTLASAVIWTRMAGGNDATSLLAIFASNLIGWLVTPTLLTATTRAEVQLDPAAMIVDLAVALLVPLAAGQCLRLWTPARQVADRRKTLLSAVAQCFVLMIVLKTATGVGERLATGTATLTIGDIAVSGAMAIGIHTAALFAGFWSGLLFGFDRPRRLAIAFAGSQKTLPVAVLVFETSFQSDFPLAIIPLLFFHAGQLVLDTAIAHRLRSVNPGATP